MINAHYTEMTNMPITTYKQASIYTFYDTTEKYMRCLKILDKDLEKLQLLSLIEYLLRVY